MSVAMSLLALLDEGPSYGLRLKQQFEARTGGVWPLNVGQVYTTLERLERDGLVRSVAGGADEAQKPRELTEAGRARLRAWFEQPSVRATPARDELVVKLVMAARQAGIRATDVIQTERRGAVESLREFTKLKRDETAEDELGWGFLVDSLIFQMEARVRWFDACEARLRKSVTEPAPEASALPDEQPSEVAR